MADEGLIRVLVIDDSAYNRQTLTAMLESDPGIKVVGRAGDGDEGLQQALTLCPDVITLDLEMPRMDGYTCLRLLMARQPTPVIVVSSHSGKSDVFRALELGALDFVAKLAKGDPDETLEAFGYEPRADGGWSVTPVITFQSGFPIGVSQNQATQSFLFGNGIRPTLVPGQDFLVPGDITDRITTNVSDNLYLNRGAFATTPVNQFANTPRILPGIYSPWRNNVDLGIRKNVRTGGGTSASINIEVLNMFNIVQWAAMSSSQFGNSSFGQINNQANNARMVQFTVRFQF